MPRRELLTSQERALLLAFPDDQAELIRLATLASDDLAFVRQRRGEHNRLGIAVLMVYLRYGRVLGEEEKPHENLLSFVAAQLEIAPSVWELYAVRDETRREHLLDLLARLGMEQFGSREYRSISAWLEPIALQTTRGMVLAEAVVEKLRRRSIVLPPVPTIERLCGEAATRAQRKVFSILTADLSVELPPPCQITLLKASANFTPELTAPDPATGSLAQSRGMLHPGAPGLLIDASGPRTRHLRRVAPESQFQSSCSDCSTIMGIIGW